METTSLSRPELESHPGAPSHGPRDRPAARQGPAIDRSTGHPGFRRIGRP
jgi:hypothetical protein